MSIKTTNLTPDVKSRLRQAVLGAIDGKNSGPPATAKSAKPAGKVVTLVNRPVTSHPQLKTLKKINLEPLPISPMPSKSTSKISKSATADSKPVVASAVKTAKTVAKKPVVKEKIAKVKSKSKLTVAKLAGRKTISAVKPVAPAVADSKRFSLYKSGSLDWQKPVKEESLESIFSTPVKSTFKTASTKFAKTGNKPASVGGVKILLKVLAVIVGALILVVLFDIFGIYRLGFRDVVSAQTAKILYLPAGQVNGKMLSLGDYLSDLNSLSASIAQNREGLIDYSGSSDLKNKIFYRLSANLLMEDKLKAYKTEVTAKEIASQIDLLLQQAGSRKDAEAIIKNLYGLDLDTFSAKILRPMMVRESLQKAIMTDENLEVTKTAKAKAEDVLKLALATSSDFELLAKQYTEDEASINTGGDLGWVTKGQLDTRWDALVFGAATSTVVPQLVVSNYGYHIIKVEQKLKDKSTGVESVKLRHILIKVDVDKYIKSLLDQAKLVNYIN